MSHDAAFEQNPKRVRFLKPAVARVAPVVCRQFVRSLPRATLWVGRRLQRLLLRGWTVPGAGGRRGQELSSVRPGVAVGSESVCCCALRVRTAPPRL